MTARRRSNAATVVRNAHPRLRLAVSRRPNPYDGIRREGARARLHTPRAAYRHFLRQLRQSAA